MTSTYFSEFLTSRHSPNQKQIMQPSFQAKITGSPFLGNALIPSHADTIGESSLLLLQLLLPPLLDQPLNGFAVGGKPVRRLPSVVLAVALRTLQMCIE